MKNYITMSKGFTIPELIITIAILLILATLAIPTYTAILDNAEDSVARANIKIISDYIIGDINSNEFSNEEIYTYKQNKPGITEDVEYLSRHLEVLWEDLNGPGDDDNTNYLNIKNMTSEKIGIVNWKNVVGLCAYNSLYANQSFYISNSSDLAYTPDSPITLDRDYFNGALVMWYDGDYASNIYIYYVDNTGKQSREYHLLENPGTP